MTDAAALRELSPFGEPLEAATALAALDLEPFDDERPRLALNMVASADGRATLAQRSAGLSNPGDHQLFLALRSLPDAVMAGASTVRTERYGRLIRNPALVAARRARGQPEQPLAVIASHSLQLDPELPLLADSASRVAILTGPQGALPPCAAAVEYVRHDSLGAQLRELRSRLGVRSIVCEGGPTLNAQLLREGLVDDLFLTVAPLLAGGSEQLTIIAGEIPLTRLQLVRLLRSEDHLHAHYAIER